VQEEHYPCFPITAGESMRRIFAVCTLVGLALAAACGGDKSGSTTEPGQTTNLVTNGTFSATINNTAWSGVGRVAVSKSTNSLVAVAAVSPTYAITFGISPLTAPGTFSLAYLNPAGSLAIVSQSTAGGGWTTFAQGGTGSITITTYTANRIAGTFAFDAVAVSGGATGTTRVTNGTFDVTY
jgi:hypothetical protein